MKNRILDIISLFFAWVCDRLGLKDEDWPDDYPPSGRGRGWE